MLNTHLRDNLSELGVRRGVQLTRAAALSIPNNALTNVTWTAETVDSDAFIATPSTTITIPTGLNGIYAITFQITWATAQGTGSYMSITTGGVTFRSDHGNDSQVGESIVVALVATDTIVCALYQNSGGAINATGNFSAYRIGL